MKALYDHQPDVFEAVGNGSYLYRMGITEVTDTNEDGNETSHWECEEVTVWKPLSANKVLQTVMSEKYGNDYENKLINEYNAAILGLYDDDTAAAKRTAYSAFLDERIAIKTQLDEDCSSFGMPNS